MKIADYFVLISPAGTPAFSTGLQEIQRDPTILSGFLRAIDQFTKEEFVEINTRVPSGVRHITWKDFNVTLCDLNWGDLSTGDDEGNLADPSSLATLLATFNFSGRPHLQDPDILKGILNYLFDQLEVKTVINNFVRTGRSPPESFTRELDSRIQKVIFGDISREYKTKGLIVTVGITWGSIFSALLNHDPEYTVFLCSDVSESIARGICKTFGLVEKEDYEILLTDPDDTSMVAKATADAHLRIQKKTGGGDIIINSTGGTKTLTSGAMHYGFVRQITTCYVLSREFRKKKEDRFYGDEEILLLDNPVQSVGFFYEKQAINAFNSQNFRLAKRYFAQLAYGIRDLNVVAYFEGLTALSEAYDHQKHGKYREMVPLYQEALGKFRRFCYTRYPYSEVVKEFLPHLEKQKTLAQKLASKEPQDPFLHICEQMNQCYRLIEEGYYQLAVLQGSLVLDSIFEMLLPEKPVMTGFKAPAVVQSGTNFLLALDVKLEALKEMHHEFIINSGHEVLETPVVAMKEYFSSKTIRISNFVEDFSNEALEMVERLLSAFIDYTVGKGGYKDYDGLLFLKIQSSIL
ncbi:MAG: hypothetical protein ACXAEU_06530 [Candidatus Hodarchaeales archaeon]